MYQELTKLQREMMEKYRLDALVTMSPENITYLTGTSVPTQITVRQREVAHILTMDCDPEVIIVNIEEPLMRMQGWIPGDKITAYNEFTQKPMMLTIETLKRMGVENKRIGFELSYVPATDLFMLQKELPDAEIVNADELYEEMRMVKLPFELRRIQEFGAQVEDVIYGVFANAKAGMTEKELQNMLVNGFNRIGGDKLNIPVVASGERSVLLNGAATDRVLKKGDLVRIDLIGLKNNYQCDCCRTAVVGDPDPVHLNIWEKVVCSHDDAIAKIRPGVGSKTIYDSFYNQFIEWGFDPVAFVGHGLGLSLHEEPYINPYKNTLLRENMVLCVEPIITLDGCRGYQLENEVLVTGDGHQMITGTKSKYDYSKLPVIEA